ncbi:MAG: hypothetical protein M0017_11720, partial [Desulfobacteraceae bacterium]|nr:hypothetical protein [Desulfobacteraceae bacterium]
APAVAVLPWKERGRGKPRGLSARCFLISQTPNLAEGVSRNLPWFRERAQRSSIRTGLALAKMVVAGTLLAIPAIFFLDTFSPLSIAPCLPFQNELCGGGRVVSMQEVSPTRPSTFLLQSAAP